MYGKRFISQFNNRQSDNYIVEVWQKGFTGDPYELTGAETPFTLSVQDTDVLEPVKATQAAFSFIINDELLTFLSGSAEITLTASNSSIAIAGQTEDNGVKPGMTVNIDGNTYTIKRTAFDAGVLTLYVYESLTDATLTDEAFTINETLTLNTFYSDDDEMFLLIFKDASTSLFTGFVVQDESNEAETDIKHVVTIKATDNLALLRNFNLNDVIEDMPVKASLFSIITSCLSATGLFSLTEDKAANLPMVVFMNVFENSMGDRTTNSAFNILDSVYVTTNIFKDDERTYKNCFDIISDILSALNAYIIQVNSTWYISRPNEYYYFASTAIAGTSYTYSSGSVTIGAVTFSQANLIARAAGDLYPVQEDLLRSVYRPLKNVVTTFNYEQPPYIDNAALSLPDDATPYTYVTDDGIRYENFNIVLYFTTWVSRGDILSYLQRTVDVATETELERYIVIPGPSNSDRAGIQFNPIEVTKRDSFNFSCSVRTLTDVSGLSFWARFNLITTDGKYYTLDFDLSPDPVVYWVGPTDAEFWDENNGVRHDFSTDNLDTSKDWLKFDLSADFPSIPSFPADGVLLIEILGTNAGGSTKVDTVVKDILLTIQQSVNASIYLKGQKHTNIFNENIKAVLERDISLDDTQRNTIAGTLFTSDLVNFDYTDSFSGEETQIGNRAFYRTKNWHIGSNDEALRLGNIVTRERLQLQYAGRFLREGSFRALHANNALNMLAPVRFAWLTGKTFLWRGYNIDYMQAIINGRLQEIYNDREAQEFEDNYQFSFIYDKQIK